MRQMLQRISSSVLVPERAIPEINSHIRSWDFIVYYYCYYSIMLGSVWCGII